jgi:RimJ/RimL family protein N-acetyltransferase
MSNPSSISIRPYAPDHVEDLFGAARESIREVHPWLPWCHPGYAIEEARSWVEGQVAAFARGEEHEFAIFGPSGRYVGGCGVNLIVQSQRRANLGYWVRSSEMGKGVAVAAVRLAAAWAFQNTALERLEIVVAVGNTRSQRVAEKAGAVREGVLRRRLLLHDTFHDAVMYSLVRGDPQRTARRRGGAGPSVGHQ